MRILIANANLRARAGTQMVVRDLALGLRAAGHEPMAYSGLLGPVAEEIAAAGIPVVSDLHSLPSAPDIIHGNHHLETVQTLAHFPEARALFVCHDRVIWQSISPYHPRIVRYVAVSHYLRERLVQDYGVPEHQTEVMYNWVDTERFKQRAPLPPRPERALIFSGYAAKNTHLEAVQEACARLNLPLDVVGAGVGNECAQPENILGMYDLVFAKGRAALEAMAVGAAVILCDTHGLGTMVTLAAVPELRRWNFGMRALDRPQEPALIVEEIQRYDPVDARAVSDYIRAQAPLKSSIDAYVALYRRILAEPLPALPPDRELSTYIQRSLQKLSELEFALARARVAASGEAADETSRNFLISEQTEIQRLRRKLETLENSTLFRLVVRPLWQIRTFLRRLR